MLSSPTTRWPTARRPANWNLIRDRVAAIREYLEAAEHLLGMLLKKGAITPAVVRQIEIK